MQVQNMETIWSDLDQRIADWWDSDLVMAREKEIREDEKKTLLYLPFPYVTAGGAVSPLFPEMYAWDTYFINLGLLAHGRLDIVKYHILNQLFLIGRYGMVLNGNRSFYVTRSQTPLLSDGVRKYYEASKDIEILRMAYPCLKKEYEHYWTAEHHNTPIGLATNRDLGDTMMRPELLSEAETGLDFSALFDGNIHDCVPLLTNSALAKYESNMAWMAGMLGWDDEKQMWTERFTRRKELMTKYCWNDEEGFFFEFSHAKMKQLQYWSLCAYWTIWAGVADKDQAARLVSNLYRFEHEYGLSQTDIAYPSPHPEYDWLQWGYPSGWPPMHIIISQGLKGYGFVKEAKRVAGKFLTLQLSVFDKTNLLWEKYNVVDGNIEFPIERYALPPFRGWAAGSVVVLGRILFD